MIGVVTEVTGGKEVLASFSQLAGLYSDLSPIFEAVGAEVGHDIQRRFEAQGPGWQPLAPSTVARKGSTRILRDSDTLYGSFEKGAAGNITRIAQREAEFGSNIFYGVFHQEGRGVPKRTIIEVTGEQEAKYSRIASDVQNDRIRSLGFHVE